MSIIKFILASVKLLFYILSFRVARLAGESIHATIDGVPLLNIVSPLADVSEIHQPLILFARGFYFRETNANLATSI